MGITQVVLVLGLCFICLSTSQTTQNIERIGNKLKGSTSGVDVKGAIFLLNEYVLGEGVVFAFSAFFRSDSPVRFQIWRPTSNTTADFRLVAETRHVPSVLFSREDVYIESKLTQKCIRVRTDDRIGVYFEEAPGAIAYTFDDKTPTALGVTLKNTSVPTQPGEIVMFTSLTFPYDFSMAAYVHTNVDYYANDTDPSADFVTCPKGMLIPNFDAITVATSTTTTVTAPPGATGATGPQGNQGGTGATGPVGPIGSNGTMGATGMTGNMGATGPMGYNGTMGATGPMGGNGATGSTGPKGDKGDQGPAGPPGPPGNAGNDGNGTYPTAQPVSNVEESFFSDPMFSMILLIWLIVVTVVIVILLITLCCCYCCKSKEEDEEKLNKSYDNNAYEKKYKYNEDLEADLSSPNNVTSDKRVSTVSYLEGQPSWVNTMKSTSESVISNNTIEEDDTPTNKKGGFSSLNGGTDNVHGSQSNLVNSTNSLTPNGDRPSGPEGKTEF